MPLMLSRRALFVAVVRLATVASLALATGGSAPLGAHVMRCGPTRRRTGGGGGPHPDPRPGIDASHVAGPETVRAHPRAVAAFDEARTIPEILDGIRCQCGCADEAGMRSLLSCYEGKEAMALECEICQGQARLAFRLKAAGQSLDQIRAAIDARYGG